MRSIEDNISVQRAAEFLDLWQTNQYLFDDRCYGIIYKTYFGFSHDPESPVESPVEPEVSVDISGSLELLDADSVADLLGLFLNAKGDYGQFLVELMEYGVCPEAIADGDTMVNCDNHEV